MKTFLKSLLVLSTPVLFLMGLASPSIAQEMKEAPLVDGLADLRKLSKKLVALSAPSAAATVSLVSTGAGGAGSGVIVSEEGLVLTAAHVVASLSDEVIVIFPDGKRVRAEKLGGDYDRDAAMVRITEEGSYPFVKVGESGDLLRNEWCVAFGHPGGFDSMRTPPVRLGRVLKNGQFVTTDCAVVGGDSGGPLFDIKGEVIGIHSNIGSTLTENRHVPIDVFLESWDDMVEGKRTGARFAGREEQIDPDRPVLGINLDGPAEDGGVVLAGVMENSPAEKAGLQAGDVVMEIDGDTVDSPEELVRAVGEFKAGDKLTVSYQRGEEKEEVEIELARLGDLMEAPPERPDRDRRRRNRERPRDDAEGDEDEGDVPGSDDESGGDEKENEEGGDGAAQARKEIEKLLRESLRRGDLDLDEKQLEQLGGMAELERVLRELAESIGPEALRDMLELEVQSGPDDFFESAMKSLQPVTGKAAKSVVAVQVNGEPVALGTVVSGEGHILTKNTETLKGEISRSEDGGKVPLKLIKRFPKRDLALYQGPSGGLEPVRWTGKKKNPIGTLLTTPGPDGAPLGIGLISVLTRALGEIGFLGIQAGEGDGGVVIVRIVNGSPAQKAGLRADDVITHVDGKALMDPFAFGSKIRTYRAGDEVEFTYRRGEEEQKISVKLASRPEEQSSGRFRRMNEMSGPLSERISGFPLALQHDIPIPPSFCGGPLLDLQGRCVGINVSRAGRVKTLAIPTEDLRELLASVEGSEEEKSGPRVADKAPRPSPAPGPDERAKERERVLKELRQVEERLRELEKELEELKK
jgi:serine protease Do